MTDLSGYHEFIAAKSGLPASRGFVPHSLPERLFAHQKASVEFAIEKGRAALFLDTGLGKSGCEAVFAGECIRETNKPSLILTPLAVARQMVRECEAFGVEAHVVRDASEQWSGVNVCNYERMTKLDLSKFGAVVLDESSILKSFTGPTKRGLVAAFNGTRYRLAATATPAPNDHMELGNHSEFLGGLQSMEMLARWFINDTSTASQEWRVKGHAEADFWRWVASWARAAGLPSDMGGDDEGFILPPLRYHVHSVATDLMSGEFEGLFRIPDQSATSIHREKRETISERVGKAADLANTATGAVIVWCETNDESAALAKAIPDAVEVHGAMKPEEKEAALDAFTFGERRVIVTKPKLAGFGLNWQHANTVVFASISHSYEQHYQAIRRSWRFGQTRPVDCHVVIAETEQAIWANVQRKAADHDKMKRAMTKAMAAAQSEISAGKRSYTRAPEVTLPKFLRG